MQERRDKVQREELSCDSSGTPRYMIVRLLALPQKTYEVPPLNVARHGRPSISKNGLRVQVLKTGNGEYT